MGHDTFRAIYDEHGAGVRRLLHRMGIQRDLDDVVQETFIKVFQNLDRFEARSSMKTWIYSVAMNTARDYHRQVKRRRWLLFGTDDEPQAKSPERPDEQVADREMIVTALAKLSPKLRETLILYSLEDLDLEDIAKVLKVPVGTVKSRLHEARQQLKAWHEKGAN